MRGFEEISERIRRSTVQVVTSERRGAGSGVIWSADGLIVTNAHVAMSEPMSVELWDGRRFEGRVVDRDPRRDLAALRIGADGLEAATPGDSNAVRPGEVVIAVGNPLGFVGALSSGIVHSIGPLPGMGREDWIRAYVRLAPGNSGGPLANAKGEVIGINTAIAQGLGVASPISRTIDFLRRGARPALGVTLRPVRMGLLILGVDPRGAAAAASLRPADILLATFEELNDLLDSELEFVRLKFVRDDRDRIRRVSVRLRARSEAA
jgi:serine protease Do